MKNENNVWSDLFCEISQNKSLSDETCGKINATLKFPQEIDIKLSSLISKLNTTPRALSRNAIKVEKEVEINELKKALITDGAFLYYYKFFFSKLDYSNRKTYIGFNYSGIDINQFIPNKITAGRQQEIESLKDHVEKAKEKLGDFLGHFFVMEFNPLITILFLNLPLQKLADLPDREDDTINQTQRMELLNSICIRNIGNYDNVCHEEWFADFQAYIDKLKNRKNINKYHVQKMFLLNTQIRDEHKKALAYQATPDKAVGKKYCGISNTGYCDEARATVRCLTPLNYEEIREKLKNGKTLKISEKEPLGHMLMELGQKDMPVYTYNANDKTSSEVIQEIFHSFDYPSAPFHIFDGSEGWDNLRTFLKLLDIYSKNHIQVNKSMNLFLFNEATKLVDLYFYNKSFLRGDAYQLIGLNTKNFFAQIARRNYEITDPLHLDSQDVMFLNEIVYLYRNQMKGICPSNNNPGSIEPYICLNSQLNDYFKECKLKIK